MDDCTRMEELESALRQLLQERFPEIRLALLFGSAAREQLDAESDIDLAVATDRPLSARQRLAVIDAVAMATGRAVDLVDLMQFNDPITQAALRTDRTLFSCDGAFRGNISPLSRHPERSEGSRFVGAQSARDPSLRSG